MAGEGPGLLCGTQNRKVVASFLDSENDESLHDYHDMISTAQNLNIQRHLSEIYLDRAFLGAT